MDQQQHDLHSDSGGPLWKLAGARAETLGLLKDRYTSRADPDAPTSPTLIPSDAMLDASIAASSAPSERRPSLWCIAMIGVLMGWLSHFFVSSSCQLVVQGDTTYGLWEYRNDATSASCVAYRDAGQVLRTARGWHALGWVCSTAALAAAWWHLIQGGVLSVLAERIAVAAAFCEVAVAFTLVWRGRPGWSSLWMAVSCTVWMMLAVELRRTRTDVIEEKRRDDVELAVARYYTAPSGLLQKNGPSSRP